MIGNWFVGFKSLNCEGLLVYQKPKLNDIKNLVQDDLTVEQYSARFMELARFVINLIPDEQSKAERFENGLNPRIRERVMCYVNKDYVRLVDVASLAEKGIRESDATYKKKKKKKSD
jgi:hypothetical protein